MSPLTTHVLDTARGCPGADIAVTLDRLDDAGAWRPVSAGRTNADGRLPGLLPPGALARATYRLRFDIDGYNAQLGQQGFYPYAEIVFRVTAPEQHHHVPLLLSPYGYQTYRGS